jgi:hypothetical protein
MKSLFTLFVTLFFGVVALANTNDHSLELNPKILNYDQVESTQMDTLLDAGNSLTTKYNQVKTTSEKEVARLYKFKNSRIKKALSFRTKKNKSRIA